MMKVAELIDYVLSDVKNRKNIQSVKKGVKELTKKFPLYKNLLEGLKKI